MTLTFAPSCVAAQVKFEKDVLPLLKAHCFDCHAGENREGDLLLDSIEGIKRGGHTGNRLLAESLADSELFLRISSTSDGFRMPKRREPLSEKEIDTIGSWIKQYSQLETIDPKTPSTDMSARATPERSLPVTKTLVGAADPAETKRTAETVSQTSVNTGNSSLIPATTAAAPQSERRRDAPDAIKFWDQASIVIGCCVLVLLLAWLLFNGGKKRKRRNSIEDPWAGRSPRTVGWTLLGLFNTLLFLGIYYYHGRCSELERENLRLQSSTPHLRIPPPTIVNADNLPLPPHPMHPPRLGGKYYRGNDERDESLFNGGFYRTATIDLHLVDSNASRLQWNDELGSAQSIEITIKRAPKATRELFTQRVLDSISIEHFCQSDASLQESLTFDVVEEEQTWRALVPLPPVSRWQDRRMQGMIYLMYGIQPGEPPTPRPHFGIRYDLKATGTKVDACSELWMGSLYTLGGRVMVPDEKRVLLDRWFDWRPIPIIDGEASADSELLGLPEHVNNASK